MIEACLDVEAVLPVPHFVHLDLELQQAFPAAWQARSVVVAVCPQLLALMLMWLLPPGLCS